MVRILNFKEVDKHWKYISVAIKRCLPEDRYMADGAMDKIKADIETGVLTCWIVHHDKKVSALFVTAIMPDLYIGQRLLVVYVLYIFKKLNAGDRADMKTALREYMISHVCYDVFYLVKLEV